MTQVVTTAGAIVISTNGCSTAPTERRNCALVLFIVVLQLISMSISQEETPAIGSFAYWVLVGLAGLLPLTAASALLKTLFGRARMLLLFGLTAGAWHLMAGDMRAVLQLGLIVWVLAWISSDRGRIGEKDLVWIYIALVAIGFGVWLLTDLNKWGIVPGTTVDEYGVWRVSFFPNIANTAILSLAVVLILTRTAAAARAHPIVLGVALYFVIFSFVRTALIALVMYGAMRWWLSVRRSSRRAVFWVALLVGIGINVALASSVFVIDYAQQFPLFSRLFLRDESGLTPDEIYQQLYRPWLWWQQLTLFVTSPSLMGWGAFDFAEMQIEELNVGTTPTGNEAILTRLLATYGLPALLFMFYLIARLWHSARSGDIWACACFPSIILLMMQWGNIFHPADPNGTVFMLILVHGSKAILLPSEFVVVQHGAGRPRSAASDHQI